MSKSFLPTKCIFLFLLLIAGNILLTGCWDQEPSSVISLVGAVKSSPSSSDQKLQSSPRSTTVWSTNQILLEDHTVSSGETLVIEPGLIVYLAEDVSIIIEGTLKADGSPVKNIIFTAVSEGVNWGEIRFDTLK